MNSKIAELFLFGMFILMLLIVTSCTLRPYQHPAVTADTDRAIQSMMAPIK